MARSQPESTEGNCEAVGEMSALPTEFPIYRTRYYLNAIGPARWFTEGIPHHEDGSVDVQQWLAINRDAPSEVIRMWWS